MFRSLLTIENPYNSLQDLIKWIEERNNIVKVKIERTSLDNLKKWNFNTKEIISHESGKFFSIQGIHVETDYGKVKSWDQPIINQPEIGYLGILCKEINGVLYFLMQAKIEPGNVNCVQISPTLQATKSNYTSVHKGKKPAYLDYFINAKPHQILLDQLQSEQGARFLRKRNRNIIIKVDDDIQVYEDFRWMTLGQIKELIYQNNLVNMDTRTVISGIDFSKYYTPLVNIDMMSEFGKKMFRSSLQETGMYSMDENISWLSSLKSKYDLTIKDKPINQLDGWSIKNDEISRDDHQFFKIIGVNVTISNREIASWCQPIVQPLQQGLCAFIIKKIGNISHFLIQAKLECGNYDILELAPTVQCLTGNYIDEKIKPPFVDYVLKASSQEIIYDVLQSEEGGRFYHEQNRNIIIEVGEKFPNELPENYRWMTLKQIYEFLRYNNFLNIQARSLISAIKYI
jgi:oxidase EvaA